MTKEEVRFQVAISVIQGVLEAKHGIIGEIVPAVAVKESLRIADEFVEQWFGETTSSDKKDEGYTLLIHQVISYAYSNKAINEQTYNALQEWFNNKILP